jgi:hypothetical protein
MSQQAQRTWAWRTKINEVLNVPRRSSSFFSGSSEELVVRVDKRSPSPTAPVDKRWPSNESDVMVGGERFGISHEDLVSINDKMNTALERVENMSRVDDMDESFDEMMSTIENRISLLYEEYERLIGTASIDDEGRIMDIIDTEVGFYLSICGRERFSKYLAAQEAEITCGAIKQKIDDILTHLDQLDRKTAIT